MAERYFQDTVQLVRAAASYRCLQLERFHMLNDACRRQHQVEVNLLASPFQLCVYCIWACLLLLTAQLFTGYEISGCPPVNTNKQRGQCSKWRAIVWEHPVVQMSTVDSGTCEQLLPTQTPNVMVRDTTELELILANDCIHFPLKCNKNSGWVLCQSAISMLIIMSMY